MNSVKKYISKLLVLCMTLGAFSPITIYAQDELTLVATNFDNNATITNVLGAEDINDATYLDAPLTFIFSEALNADTVTAANIIVTEGGTNRDVSEAVMLSKDGKSLSIGWDNFRQRESYTIIFTPEIESVDGDSLAQQSYVVNTGIIYKDSVLDDNKVLSLLSLNGNITAEAVTNGVATESVITDAGELNDGYAEIDTSTAPGTNVGRNYLTIDLGREYELVAVGTTWSQNSDWHAYETHIYVNSSVPSIDYGETVATITMDDTRYNGVHTHYDTVLMPAEVTGRYVTFHHATSNLYSHELYAIGYVENTFGEGEASLDGNEITFTVPIERNFEKDYQMLISTYDENGKMIATVKNDAVNIGIGSENAISSSVLAEGVTSAKAIVVLNSNERYICSQPVLYGDDVLDDYDSSKPEINYGDAGDTWVEIAGERTDGDEIITISIVQSEATDSEVAFAEFESVSDYIYFSAVAAERGYTLRYTFETEGTYHIRISRNGEDEYYKYTAVVPDDFSEWTITDAGEGIKRASIDVGFNSNPSKSYIVFASAFDENGKMIGDYAYREFVGTVGETEKTLWCEVDYSGNATGIRATVVNAEDITVPVTEPYVSGNLEVDNSTLDEDVEFTNFDESVSVSGKATEDFMLVSVIKSESENSADVFSNSTANDFKFIAPAPLGEDYSFDIQLTEEGKYHIAVASVDSDFSKSYTYHTVYAVDPDMKEQALADFTSDDPEIISAKAYEYINAVNPEKFIDGKIIDEDAISEEGFGEIYVDIKDMIISEENAQLSEIITAINTAIAANALLSGDTTLYESNSSLITDNEEIFEYVRSMGVNPLATVTCSVPEGDKLTNIGNDGLLELTFGQPMRVAQLTQKYIAIYKNGVKVDYEPLEVSADKYVIDLTSLAQDYTTYWTHNGTKYVPTSDVFTIELSDSIQTQNGDSLYGNTTFTYEGGILINAPRKEGKIIKNVALGKPVSHLGTSASNAQKLTDGNTTATAENWAQFVGGGGTIDLGKFYDVCGVYFVGPNRADFVDVWYVVGLSILASDTGEFDGDSVTLYNKVTNQNDRTVEHFTQTSLPQKPMRYIWFDKDRNINTSTFAATELEVYAYVDEDSEEETFSSWSLPDNVNAGTKTFSITATNPKTDYDMLLAAYDADGNVVVAEYYEDVITQTQENVTASKTISIPSGTAGITAMLIDGANTMKMVADSATVGTSLAEEADTAGVTFNAENNGVIIDVGANDVINKTDKISVIAIADTEGGKTAEEAFEEVNPSNIESKIKYAAATTAKAGFTIDMTSLPVGYMYYVRVTVTDVYGEVKNYYYKFNNDSDIGEYITAVMEAENASDAADALTGIVDTAEVIDRNLLIDDTIAFEGDFAEYFVYTKEMLYPSTLVSDVTDVVNLINATTLVYYMSEGALTQDMLDECEVLFGENLDKTLSAVKMNEVFSNLKSDITDYESFQDVFEWSQVLSQMKGADNQTFADIMSENSDLLGIDTTGVTLERVAAYMDKTNVTQYYGTTNGKTNFNIAFLAAKKKVSSESGSTGSTNSKPSQSFPSVPSYSGGVSGGNGSTSTNSTPKPVQTTNGITYKFSDIAGYEWAHEAISNLVNKNVVDGNEKGEFLPANSITRAEFVKMFVEAMDINVDEKVESYFEDLHPDDWYYPYIVTAYSKEIVNGVSESKFDPHSPISRQDMSVIINNYLETIGQGGETKDTEFIDNDQIADYALGSVANMKEKGFILGFDDGTFRPNENTRRVDAAVLINRLIENL